jgi:hypothetical protein
MKETACISILFAIAMGLQALATVAGEPADSRVALARDDAKGELRISIDGKEALVYRFGNEVDLPHFHPILSPAGEPMTVDKTTPYPHHRAFWFADKVQLAGKRTVEFYGAYYSGQGTGADRKPPFRDHIRQVEFVPGKTTKDQAEIAMKLVWEMDNDVPVLDELRNVRIAALGEGEYFLDLTFTVTAAYGDVQFTSDAVHYAWPYLRMNREFSVEGGGKITNSEGGVNQKGTNGQAARWVDYSNTSGGKSGGLAVFSHSDNEQPHRWLTRDYGTFGPRRPDAKSGKPFTLAKGQSLKQRIGVLVHRGDVEAGKVAKRYQQYVDGKL